MSVLDADVTMRFWEARLLPFELLLPPTCFSARLVSASWLVAFVHFVRGPGIIISDHLGGFTAKEGLFMFANKALEGIVLRTGTQQLKFAIVGREAHTCASPTALPWALVTERPVALPPVWLEEGSMSKTDQYRQFAHDCIVWARIATSDDQREQFLELAKKWMSDAESIDRGTELQPNEAVKASEMAGEEIDRLGDPLATDEERQLRKQRLIKGPQEFRDIRSNRAKIEPRFPE